MTSRLTIMNDCLLLTGNNPFNAPDDGSVEWNTVSAAYDGAVEYLLDEHDWKFATAIITVTTRISDSPDLAYEDYYEKPDGCLHVIWVQDLNGNKLDWRVVGNKICVTEDGGIKVKCVMEPEPEAWPGIFLKSLKHFVMGGCYRGLNKDAQAARAEEKAGDVYLSRARPRGDTEEPGKAKFVSSLAAARSRRRG